MQEPRDGNAPSPTRQWLSQGPSTVKQAEYSKIARRDDAYRGNYSLTRVMS